MPTELADSLAAQVFRPVAAIMLNESDSIKEVLMKLPPALKQEGSVIYLTAACRPHPLLTARYAAAMHSYPETALWYADETRRAVDDKLELFCKPAWDPLYFSCTGYTGQCFAVRGDLFYQTLKSRENGGPERTPHAQDLFSAALETLRKRADAEPLVGHLPVPLHHITAKFSPSPQPRLTRLKGAQPSVSIVIPFRERPDLLCQCLTSLLEKTDYPDWECVLVDNGSREPETISYLSGLSAGQIQLIHHDVPFNFSALVNLGVTTARGEIIVLLNNDITAISPQWLSALVEYAARPEIGCVGAKLLYPNHLVQHGGILCGEGLPLDAEYAPTHAHLGWPGDSEGYYGLLSSPRTVSAVTGAALAVRKSLYVELGGFDEELAVAMNDVDFCLKAWQKGFRCVWTPESVLIHHESATRKMDVASSAKRSRLLREWAIMRKRWGERLAADPWYNPNLSRDYGYELRQPPGVRLPRVLTGGWLPNFKEV